MSEEVKLGEFDHIGHVVRDRDATMKSWTALLGVDDWTTDEFDAFNLSLAFCTLGNTKIELLQPNDDKSVWGVFLKEHGEGLHHVCVHVADADAAAAALVEKGGEIVLAMPGILSYVNIGGPGSIILELLKVF